MKMKPYVLNFAGYVRVIRVLRESYYFVPEAKAVHLNKKPDATAVCVMSGINMIWKVFIFVSEGKQIKNERPERRDSNMKSAKSRFGLIGNIIMAFSGN
jgi:hypothetical protein